MNHPISEVIQMNVVFPGLLLILFAASYALVQLLAKLGKRTSAGRP